MFAPGMTQIPPLSLAYLAGTLEQAGFSVDIIDGIGEALDQKVYWPSFHAYSYGLSPEEIVERVQPDSLAIGLSCMFTMEWPFSKLVIQTLKKKYTHIPLICGGEHITADVDQAMKECPEIDYCVLGEGEETLRQLCQILAKPANGKTPSQHELANIPGIVFRSKSAPPTANVKANNVKANNATNSTNVLSLPTLANLSNKTHETIEKTPPAKRIRDVNTIARPAWHLTRLEDYLNQNLSYGVKRGRSMPMLATRGCPYACTFCSNVFMWGTNWIPRDVDDLIDEMAEYRQKYQVTNFDFYDLTTIINKKWIQSFAQAIIDKGWRITWQLPAGTRSEALDRETLRLLYASGCRNFTFAPENGSPRMLKIMKKRVKLDHMLKAMFWAWREGFNTKFNIILGYPGETIADLNKSLWFIVRAAIAGVNDVAVKNFSPYPGSPVFNELAQEGKITVNEDYYKSLLLYNVINDSISWNPSMNPKILRIYRTSSIVLFYMFSYITHPWRPFKIIFNIWSGKHESRLETVLADTFSRISMKEKQSAVISESETKNAKQQKQV